MPPVRKVTTFPFTVAIDVFSLWKVTGKVEDARICEVVKEVFPLSPAGIIDHLKLRRPIFQKTAAGGHFGRNDEDFTWESTDKAAEIAAKIDVAAAV